MQDGREECTCQRVIVDVFPRSYFFLGGPVGFLCRPNRFGPLHHAAGEGRSPGPDPLVPQPREESPAGRDQRPDPRRRCPGPLLRHEEAGHPRHQGGLGERPEGRGRREGQFLVPPVLIINV